MKKKYVSMALEIREVSQKDVVCASSNADICDVYDGSSSLDGFVRED